MYLCENHQYQQGNRFVKYVLQTSGILTQKSALCALKHTVIKSSLTEHLGQREMQICNLRCQHLHRVFGRMKYKLPYMTISHSSHAPTCFCHPPPPGTSQQCSPHLHIPQTALPRRPSSHHGMFWISAVPHSSQEPHVG